MRMSRHRILRIPVSTTMRISLLTQNMSPSRSTTTPRILPTVPGPLSASQIQIGITVRHLTCTIPGIGTPGITRWSIHIHGGGTGRIMDTPEATGTGIVRSSTLTVIRTQDMAPDRRSREIRGSAGRVRNAAETTTAPGPQGPPGPQRRGTRPLGQPQLVDAARRGEPLPRHAPLPLISTDRDLRLRPAVGPLPPDVGQRQIASRACGTS